MARRRMISDVGRATVHCGNVAPRLDGEP
jgi:hypothetical protein